MRGREGVCRIAALQGSGGGRGYGPPALQRQPAPGKALVIDAYTDHAGAVTAFRCDSEATRPSHDTAEFVPGR
jgi:hypothetical protein